MLLAQLYPTLSNAIQLYHTHTRLPLHSLVSSLVSARFDRLLVASLSSHSERRRRRATRGRVSGLGVCLVYSSFFIFSLFLQPLQPLQPHPSQLPRRRHVGWNARRNPAEPKKGPRVAPPASRLTVHLPNGFAAFLAFFFSLGPSLPYLPYCPTCTRPAALLPCLYRYPFVFVFVTWGVLCGETRKQTEQLTHTPAAVLHRTVPLSQSPLRPLPLTVRPTTNQPPHSRVPPPDSSLRRPAPRGVSRPPAGTGRPRMMVALVSFSVLGWVAIYIMFYIYTIYT